MVEDDRQTHWHEEPKRFSVSDYDGETLIVSRRSYKDFPEYIAVDYDGQGPVVLEIDEAREFIRRFTKLVDEAEKGLT